ncbi:MAG: AAA family ATPase [Pseudomonadota bacterium]
MICATQKKVVKFLSSAKNFCGLPVERIDTHLSHIFLVGDRAFKIKRDVRYNFVDFSTVKLRQKACEDEVELNRRTAPTMYLRTVPIYDDRSQVTWTKKGEPIEWAVEMKRFNTEDQLDNLIAKGALKVDIVNSLADKIASFHLAAQPVYAPQSSVLASNVIRQISSSFESHEIHGRKLARWTELALGEYRKHATFLEGRRRHGWIRRCHGDLHLGNICMFEGAPTPFDAIEFNDDLANIDVLYDLAFTLMDLVNHDRKDLANALLNRYLSLTLDYSGVRALNLFQSMRAMIRAMVDSLPTRAEESERLTMRYIDSALAFLTKDDEPRLIAVGGYSGTGKSKLARALALRFNGKVGAILLQSDSIRKRLVGRNPETRLSHESYTPEMSERVYRQMFRNARRALRAGYTVVLDATFLEADYRAAAQALVKKAETSFDGLWLHAPREVLTVRVKQRRNDISDASVSVLKAQLERKVDPTPWAIVDASRKPGDTLTEALASLNLTDDLDL